MMSFLDVSGNLYEASEALTGSDIVALEPSTYRFSYVKNPVM
jgi:hypothetical protein